jgi:hypothetical protein
VRVSKRTLLIIFLHPPAPMNNLGIRIGVINPPLATYDDDSDNEATCEYRLGTLASQEAVRLVNLGGEGSPDRTSSQKRHTASRCGSQAMSNAEPILRARKISHFRSNAKIAMPHQRRRFPDSVARTADVGDRDEHLIPKPLLVQTEVGELLQPAVNLLSGLHYKNARGMPTNTKSVHFDELRNETRYFLQVDNPMTVERPMSPKPESCLSAGPLRDASRYRHPSPTSSPVHCLSGSSGKKTSTRFGMDLISFLFVFALTLCSSYLVFGGPKLYH